MWVRSLGQEDPLKKEMATPSSILAGKSHGAWRACIRIDMIRFHSCRTTNHGLCVPLIVGLGKNKSKKWKSLQAWVSCVCTQSLQLCLTLWNPVDYSLPDSSVHGILQARILEWVVIPSSVGSSPPRDRTRVSCMTGWFFTAEPLGNPLSVLGITFQSSGWWEKFI